MRYLATGNIAGKKLAGGYVGKSVLFLLALFFALQATPANSRDMREMAGEIAKPITIKATESEKMNVTFNHASHKGISCMTCHHQKPETGGDRYVRCASCHNRPGAKERHHMSTFMAFHAKDSKSSCFGCHSKKRAEQPEKYASRFSGCYPCHAAATAASK